MNIAYKCSRKLRNWKTVLREVDCGCKYFLKTHFAATKALDTVYPASGCAWNCSSMYTVHGNLTILSFCNVEIFPDFLKCDL